MEDREVEYGIGCRPRQGWRRCEMMKRPTMCPRSAVVAGLQWSHSEGVVGGPLVCTQLHTPMRLR